VHDGWWLNSWAQRSLMILKKERRRRMNTGSTRGLSERWPKHWGVGSKDCVRRLKKGGGGRLRIWRKLIDALNCINYLPCALFSPPSQCRCQAFLEQEKNCIWVQIAVSIHSASKVILVGAQLITSWVQCTVIWRLFCCTYDGALRIEIAWAYFLFFFAAKRTPLFTTTKSIYGIGWKPIFCIGFSNRYDLYDIKNERFIVSVVADRHKKWNFENKQNSRAQT
jgi:hypothetical protein